MHGFAISDPTYANLELVDPNEGTDLGEEDIEKASEAKVNAAVPVVAAPVSTGMHNISVCCKASKLDAHEYGRLLHCAVGAHFCVERPRRAMIVAARVRSRA